MNKRKMEERRYRVTLLCSVECKDVRAFDEIGAERKALADHPHLEVVKIRVRGRGLDTGFYSAP